MVRTLLALLASLCVCACRPHPGSSSSSDAGTDTPCVPSVTCTVGQCGALDNGCGQWLDCGKCTGATTCGATGVANQCACKPLTCDAAGANCGTIPDGCGGTLTCGECTSPDTCGGGGTDNVCGHPVCRDGWCAVNPYPFPDDVTALLVDSQGVLTGGTSGMMMAKAQTAWSRVTSVTRRPADIKGMVRFADGDAWAVGAGARGALLRLVNGTFLCDRPDGKYWTQIDEETDITWELHGIWATQANDVWVVGEAGILHWDGSAWTLAESTSGVRELRAVVGTAANDIWAVGRKKGTGYTPAVMHYNGSLWSALDTSSDGGELRAATLMPDGTLLMVGANLDAQGTPTTGLVALVKDGVYQAIRANVDKPLSAVAVDANGLAWMVGDGGTMLTWNGRELTRLAPLLGRQDLKAIASGNGQLWAGGAFGLIAQFKQGAWWPNRAEVPAADGETVVTQTLPSGVTVAGGNGWAARWNGRAWGMSPLPGQVVGFFGVAHDQTWAAVNVNGHGVVMLHDGVEWKRVAEHDKELIGINGTGSMDVRAALKQGEVLHFDGTRWTVREDLAFGNGAISEVVASSEEWTLGHRGFTHTVEGKSNHTHRWPWDGLSSMPRNAWGSADNTVWVVGDDGVIKGYGSVWEKLRLDGVVHGVSGSSAQDVWLVGEKSASGEGPVWHWDGTELKSADVQPPNLTSLQSVSVTSSGRVYICGEGVHHWTGSAWEKVLDTGMQRCAVVRAVAENDVFAAVGPLLHHYDGTGWQSTDPWTLLVSKPVNAPTQEVFIHDAHGTSEGAVMFIGTTSDKKASMLLMHDASGWKTSLPLQSYGASTFSDVWGASLTEIRLTKGEMGWIYRYIEAAAPTFASVEAPCTRALGALWGTSTNELWAFGEYGTILKRSP